MNGVNHQGRPSVIGIQETNIISKQEQYSVPVQQVDPLIWSVLSLQSAFLQACLVSSTPRTPCLFASMFHDDEVHLIKSQRPCIIGILDTKAKVTFLQICIIHYSMHKVTEQITPKASYHIVVVPIKTNLKDCDQLIDTLGSMLGLGKKVKVRAKMDAWPNI